MRESETFWLADQKSHRVVQLHNDGVNSLETQLINSVRYDKGLCAVLK